jgi:serine/threonine protein kinase/tetratricopeptide (TPR) repeat protein
MVGSTIQHYRIRDRLGAGGMGEVYLAEDTRLGREVALKFLPAEAQNDQERRARFLTEARAASALRSSNIAAIYDIGQYEGADYIVMEYVDGELLSHRIHRGPIPVRDVVDIATQIEDALVEAHGRGIVHRDIKSANIIVTARGQVKVLDFGLAKFLQPPSGQASVDVALTVGEDTVAGAVLGTVSYMAPEQALGRNVDQRSDLFSAGVVIYEMLTGRLPFEGRSFGEVVDAILHHIPTPILRLNPAVPGSLEALVRKALEKNADLRYQTARDMFIDLQRVKTELDEIERHGSQLRSSTNHGQAVLPPDNSIAVVTFTNITREPADEWIGSGIAETVSADLKNVRGLTVIGRERVFDALRNLEAPAASGQDDRLAIELGRGLGARWIVSGAYQRIGESIRITARFVEISTGAVLRNVKIDGRLSDIFSLQDRIVFELTQDLNLTLEQSAINQIQQPETRSVEAYELYSRGMLTLRMATRDAPDRAIHFFEKALATDREYAEAWAGLGAAYQIKGVFLGLPELMEKALTSADEALARDPKLAEGHVVRGSAQFALGRLDDALHSYAEAISLDPKSARAHAQLARVHWVGRGDLRAGIAELERAVEINPQFGYAHHQLSYLYTELGDYAAAEREARKAVDLQEQYISGEEGFLVVGAHTRLGYVFYRQGQYEDALAEYQMELLFLSSSDHVLKERSLIELHQKLGAALVRLGRSAEARRYLQLAIRKYEERAALGEVEAATQYYVAAAYALLDDAENALRILESSVRRQQWNQGRALRDPDFSALRPAIEAMGNRERSEIVQSSASDAVSP